ncbi:hypothetical protein CAPTEDRAFT_54529, partial [Capitella teleta]
IAKVIALFATFAVIFICMSLPTKLADIVHRKKKKSVLIMGMLRCFGGGVFLGTILFHMLPEVKEMIGESINDHYGIEYPVAEAIVAGGFFMICYFEKIIMTAHRHRKRKTQAKPKTLSRSSSSSVIPSVMLIGHHGNTEDGTPSIMTEPSGGTEHGAAHARSIILLMALSFECIFDGLSVGLQGTTTGVWNLFVAVISHESIVSFCLGLEMLKFHSKRRVLLAAFCYASIPPIGNVIGIVITETSSVAKPDVVTMVNGVLLAVACGIFLYCTFIGMMGEELIEHSTFKKIFSTMVGCAIMAAL